MFLWRNVANYPRIIPVTSPYLELCPFQMPQIVTSGQGQHCLLTRISMHDIVKHSLQPL